MACPQTHTQTLTYQTRPDAFNPNTLLSNTHSPRPPGPHLPALSAHPTPTPTYSASITHDSTQMYTQSSQKTPPMYTCTRPGGPLSDILLPPHSVASCWPSAPAHNVPRPCVRTRSTGAPGVVGASSRHPPIHGTSREPPWEAEQEATPTPRMPRHLTLHPFKGPQALGEARIGVMRSRWLGAPASDDRGGPPKVGRGACLGQLRGGQGSPRGAWRPKPQAITPSSASRCPSMAPSGRRGSLPPLLGQLEFITTSPPLPPQLHPSLPCSLWSPLESRCGSQIDWFLKETNSRGGKWQGGLCLVGGERFGVVPLWAPLVLDPLAGGTLGILLGLRGLGDWGAGVNSVWQLDCVCHGPVGATEEQARPGARKQEG